MYKDKDRQREANKQAKARQRIKDKDYIKGMTKVMVLDDDVIPEDTPVVIPYKVDSVIPKCGKDIKCFADLPPDVQRSIDMMSMVDGMIDKTIKANRTAIAISYQHSRPDRYYPRDAVCSGVVTGLLGDQDYNGVCTEDWRREQGR